MLQLTNEALRVSSYFGAIEMLRTGTTCSLNHVVNVNGEESYAAICEPLPEVGIRQLVTKEVRQTPDPPFSTEYPAIAHLRPLDEELELAERIVTRWDNHGGMNHTGLAVETGATWMMHNATSEEVIHGSLDIARRLGLKITNHCGAGTPWLSIAEFQRMTGGGDIDLLNRLGALAEHWVFAHSIWLSDRELDLIAKAGASRVTKPVSNAYSCDGIAPVRGMIRAGVNVALGSDGSYVNCSVDMIEQMKFAALIQNVTHFDPGFMTVERVLEMATINGARALGLEHEIGSLEVGKRADIAIFDLDKAHTTVGNRPVAALVFSAHGTDVDRSSSTATWFCGTASSGSSTSARSSRTRAAWLARRSSVPGSRSASTFTGARYPPRSTTRLAPRRRDPRLAACLSAPAVGRRTPRGSGSARPAAQRSSPRPAQLRMSSARSQPPPQSSRHRSLTAGTSSSASLAREARSRCT